MAKQILVMAATIGLAGCSSTLYVADNMVTKAFTRGTVARVETSEPADLRADELGSLPRLPARAMTPGKSLAEVADYHTDVDTYYNPNAEDTSDTLRREYVGVGINGENWSGSRDDEFMRIGSELARQLQVWMAMETAYRFRSYARNGQAFTALLSPRDRSGLLVTAAGSQGSGNVGTAPNSRAAPVADNRTYIGTWSFASHTEMQKIYKAFKDYRDDLLRRKAPGHRSAAHNFARFDERCMDGWRRPGQGFREFRDNNTAKETSCLMELTWGMLSMRPDIGVHGISCKKGQDNVLYCSPGEELRLHSGNKLDDSSLAIAQEITSTGATPNNRVVQLAMIDDPVFDVSLLRHLKGYYGSWVRDELLRTKSDVASGKQREVWMMVSNSTWSQKDASEFDEDVTRQLHWSARELGSLFASSLLGDMRFEHQIKDHEGAANRVINSGGLIQAGSDLPRLPVMCNQRDDRINVVLPKAARVEYECFWAQGTDLAVNDSLRRLMVEDTERVRRYGRQMNSTDTTLYIANTARQVRGSRMNPENGPVGLLRFKLSSLHCKSNTCGPDTSIADLATSIANYAPARSFVSWIDLNAEGELTGYVVHHGILWVYPLEELMRRAA